MIAGHLGVGQHDGAGVCAPDGQRGRRQRDAAGGLGRGRDQEVVPGVGQGRVGGLGWRDEAQGLLFLGFVRGETLRGFNQLACECREHRRETPCRAFGERDAQNAVAPAFEQTEVDQRGDMFTGRVDPLTVQRQHQDGELIRQQTVVQARIQHCMARFDRAMHQRPVRCCHKTAARLLPAGRGEAGRFHETVGGYEPGVGVILQGVMHQGLLTFGQRAWWREGPWCGYGAGSGAKPSGEGMSVGAVLGGQGGRWGQDAAPGQTVVRRIGMHVIQALHIGDSFSHRRVVELKMLLCRTVELPSGGASTAFGAEVADDQLMRAAA